MPPARPGRLRITPRAAAFLLTATLASALAQSIFAVPVQVSDSLEPIVFAARAESTSELFMRTGLHASSTTLRPLRYVQARWLISLAERTGLPYNTVLRGTHALLIVALLFLFAAAVDVGQWRAFAAFGVALTVLIGLRTFAGMVREAYPLNHFAEVAFCALAVFALAQTRSRLSTDVAIAAMLAFCLLLVESGVLVWVAVVACAAVGLPGVKARTILVTTFILVAYVGLRQALGIGVATIGAHSSGYGATFYSADQLVEKFGAHSLLFMAYNIAGGALSVMFSEPRYGVYQLGTSAATGRLPPVIPINMLSSALLTIAIGWQTWIAARKPREWNTRERTLIVAAVMLGANAAMCATYMKDEILSVAGVFYALAAFAATDILLRSTALSASRRTLAIVVTLFLAIVGPMWAFRAAGVHFQLRFVGFTNRNDWTSIAQPSPRDGSPADLRQATITTRLKEEALLRRTISPRFLPRWGDSYWVE